jgi:8-amino-7-oxononanoate synthase
MPKDDAFNLRVFNLLQNLESIDQRRIRRCVEAISTTECIVDGQRCLSFATNDYLGLTRHPDVVAAFAQSAAKQVGAGSSSLIAGRSPHHVRLEQALAKFESTESAILFPSGFAANTGTLTSLISEIKMPSSVIVKTTPA